MTLDEIKNIVLKDGKYTCFHQIQAKLEFGGFGAGERWIASGRGNDQIESMLIKKSSGEPKYTTEESALTWLLIPCNNTDCNIVGVRGSLYAGVDTFGKIIRWKYTGGKDQQFHVFNQESGWWNIQERTKNKYFATSSTNFWCVRWPRTGGDDQRFRLIPHDVVVPKSQEPSFTVGKKRYEQAEDIPRPPAIPGIDYSPPKQSDEYLIDVELLPAVFVYDDNYGRGERISQIKKNPYYYLVRTRKWSQEFNERFVSDIEKQLTTTIQCGSSYTHVKEIETTIGVVTSGEMKGTSEEHNVSAALSSKMSYQKKMMEKESITVEGYYKIEEKTTIKSSSATRLIVCWQPVDIFTIYNYNEEQVKQWLVCDHSSFWDIYPPD